MNLISKIAIALIFISILQVKAQTPRYWVSTVTSGNWNSASSWSATPGGAPGASAPDLNSIAIISNISITPIINGAFTVGQLSISGANVVFQSTGQTLTVNNTFSGYDVVIENSNVTISGRSDATNRNTTITLAAGNTGLINQSTITANFGNNTSQALGGVITNSAGVSALTFTGNSTYLHARDGGSIPLATWLTGSVCSITGITATNPTFNSGTIFADLYWNCNAQTILTGIAGTNQAFTIGNLYVQATGSTCLGLLFANSTANFTINNISVSGGILRSHIPNGTVNLSITGNVFVDPGASLYYLDPTNTGRSVNLTIAGTNNAAFQYTGDLINPSLNLTINKLNISDNFTVSSSNLSIGTFLANSGVFNLGSSPANITIAGNATGSGTMNASGSAHNVIFNGSSNSLGSFIPGNQSSVYYQSNGNQTLIDCSYNNLYIQNTQATGSPFKTWALGANRTVTGVMDLSSASAGTQTFNLSAAGASLQATKSGSFFTQGGTGNTVLSINGAGFIINGTYIKSNGTITLVNNGAFTFTGTANYTHNQNGNVIPTAVWQTGSLVSISGVTSTSPTGFNQSFYDFIWNAPGSSGNIILIATAGQSVTVSGTFSMANSGSGTLDLFSSSSGSSNYLINNFNQTGGTLRANRQGGATININITGNFNQTSGILAQNTGTASITFTGANSSITSLGAITGALPIFINKNTNTSTINLNTNLSLPDNLTFINGIINTNGNYLSVAGANVNGASSITGWVNGNLIRSFTSTALRNLDVGNSNTYAPASVAFSTYSSPGSIQSSTTAADYPSMSSSCFDVTKSVNRYWTLSSVTGAVSPDTKSVTLTFPTSDVDGIANVANMRVGKYDGATWVYPSITGRSLNSFTIAGISGYGVFLVAEPTSVTPVGSISGFSNVCNGQTSVSYSVSSIAGITTYNWTLPGGAAIISGSGSNSILVSFSGSALSGNISVAGTNSCGANSGIAALFVNVNPNVTTISGISGNQFICLSNTSASNYTVTSLNAAIYTWSILGTGSHVYASTTSTLGVTWDAAVPNGTVVTITAFATGANACANTTVTSRTVTLNQSITGLSNIIGSNSICQNPNTVSYPYSISGTNAGSYTWATSVPSNTTITGTAGTRNIVWPRTFDGTAGITSILVTVNGINACSVTGLSASATVTIIPNVGTLSAISGTNIFVCLQTMTTTSYNTTVTNAAFYTWSIAGGNHTISGTGPTASVTWDYSYTGLSTISGFATGVNGCGTSNIQNYVVTINPIFGNSVSGAQSVCVNNTVLNPLTGSLPAIPLPYTYTWGISTTSTSGYDVGAGTSNTQNYSYPTTISSDLWFVRTVTANGCNDVSTPVKITAVTPNYSDPNTYPSGYWNAYAYGQQNFVAGSYAGKWTISGLNFDTRSGSMYGGNIGIPSNVTGYVGCQVGSDNHSVLFRTQNMVTVTGTYKIDLPYYDDGTYFSINGTQYFGDNTWYNNVPKYAVYVGPINPSDVLEVRYTQGTGGNGVAFNATLTTVGPLVNGGNISSAKTTVCQGDNLFTSNTSFTGVTTFTGGCSVSSIGYQWQSSTDGSTWSNLSGGIYANYLYNQSILQTTYFRRQVTDICNNTQFSNVLTISINFSGANPTVAGINTWNSYYYYDKSLNATQSSGPLAGAFTMPGMNFTTPGLSFDTRNYFTSGSSPSNAPGAQGCLITGSNISAKFIRTGWSSGTYQFDIPFVDDQTWMFVNGQLVAQQTACCVVVNNFFTTSLTGTDVVEFRWAQGGGGSGLYISITGPNLTVTSPIAGTVGPQVIACANEVPSQSFITVTSTTGGCPIKTYQWQASTVSGTSGFSNVAGGTSQTLSPGFSVFNTTWLQRIDTDWCGNVTTLSGALITITGTIPGDSSVFGNNIWITYGFDAYTGSSAANVLDRTKYINYKGYATIPGPNFTSTSYFSASSSPSYINNYQGCRIPSSQFSTSTKRIGFPTGQYSILFQHDDPGAILINGVAVYSNSYINGGYDNIGWSGNLGSNDKIELLQSNNNGPGTYGIQFNPVTVTGLTSAGSIGNDQTVCYNTSGIVLTSTGVAVSGGCFIYYTWISSTIPGLTSNVVTLTGLTTTSSYNIGTPILQTTYFKRIAIDACGSSLGSNMVTISVNGILLPGSINTVPGVCVGSSPTTITSLTLPTGGLGSFTYVWQSSPNNSTWTNITTATGADYTQPIAISTPTYFRRSTASATCGTAYTPSVLVGNLQNTTIISQPVNSTVCGLFALFTVGASGVSPTYQWQISTTAGQFFNLVGPTYVLKTTTFTGVTSSVLSISGTIVSISGSNFRVLINSSCGALITSTGAAGLFQGPPAITSQPSSSSVCIGNPAVYNVVASSPILSYQWKQSTDGGTTYSNINDNATFVGSNTGSLTVTGSSISMTGYKYLGVLSTTCNSLTSTGATLTVTGTIASQTITGPASVCPNTSAALSGAAPAGGGGSFTYQWMVSTVSGSTGFVNSTGATATSLNHTTPNIQVPSWFMRIATSSSGCQDISTALGITVNQATAVSIISPASNTSACSGTTVIITATATGTGTLTYQWRLGGTNLSNNAAYAGVNTPSLTLSGLVSSMTGANYTLSVASSVCVSATSGNRQITSMLAPIVIVSQPSDYTACSGSLNPIYSVSVTGSNPAYRWQVNTNGDGVSFSDLSAVNPYVWASVTSNTLSFQNGVTANNPAYRYRAKIDGSCSATQYSNSGVLSVTSPISGNSISASQSICVGIPAALNGNAPPTLTGGDGNYIYNWQYSTDNVTFLDFSPTSVTSVNYAPSTLTGTTYFRRAVYSIDCPVSNSSVLTINVSPSTIINTQPPTTGICQGNSVSFALSASGSNVSYQWQYATSTVSGGNWTNISSPNIGGVSHSGYLSASLTITTPPISYNNNQYRAIVTGDCGTSNVTSAGATLLINPTPAFVINPGSSISFCDGQTILVNSSATGPAAISYQWSQSPTGSGGPFTNLTGSSSISGFNANRLTISGTSFAINGYAYRSMAYIGGCSITGTAGTLAAGPNSWVGNSSNWLDPSNWCSGIVPSPSTSISINSGASYYPLITSSGIVVGNITIGTGASLSITGTNQLIVTGNWINSGTFSSGSSTIVFSGTGIQTIGGSNTTSFYNLTIDNPNAAIKLARDQNLTGTLSLTNNSTFTITPYSFTLVSNSSGTGRIGILPASAVINGNISVQRYLPAKRAVRFFSSPVNNATFNQLKSYIYLTGSGGTTNGFDASPYNIPTIYQYVESVPGMQNKGTTEIASTALTFQQGVGYQITMRGDRTTGNYSGISNITTTSVVVQLTGSVNRGDIPLPVSFTPSSVSSADGWNLVGNPYPSQIDWDNTTTGWNTANISNTIYIWDPGTTNTTVTTNSGVYYTYTRGLGCVPARTPCNGIIANSQAFFVKATAATPSITIHEQAKVGNSSYNSFFRQQAPVNKIRIRVEGANVADEALISLGANYSAAFEPANDVDKLSNPILNITSLSAEGRPLVINATTVPDTMSSVIPVAVSSTKKGNYSLSFSLSDFENPLELALKDKYLNTSTPVNEALVYPFEISSVSGSSVNRFEITLKRLKAPIQTINSVNGADLDPLPAADSSAFIDEEAFNNNISQNPLSSLTGSQLSSGQTVNNINEAILAPEISIYPNPITDDKFKLEIKSNTTENAHIEISNMSGHIVYTKSYQIKRKAENILHIDGSYLMPGIYIVRIKNNNWEKKIKVVKLH